MERYSAAEPKSRDGSGVEGSDGTLLSVNAGLPRDIDWQGKTVHTATWKAPVAGRRMERRLYIDGDGQGDLAGHGGEHRVVLVYQIASCRYWQDRFGRSDFTFGQFGENFAVGGLPDDEVCIGDRYRIGAGLFEVTPAACRLLPGLHSDERAADGGRCWFSVVGVTEDDWKRTYRQLAGALVPALLDMLHYSIFGGYPPAFLSSASAVRVYLKAQWGARGLASKTGATVIWLTPLLLHNCYL